MKDKRKKHSLSESIHGYEPGNYERDYADRYEAERRRKDAEWEQQAAEEEERRRSGMSQADRDREDEEHAERARQAIGYESVQEQANKKQFKSVNAFVTYLFEGTEPEPAGDPQVEFPSWLEDKLKTTHGTPGQGSIFKDPDSVKAIVLDLVEKEKSKIPEIATTTGTLKTDVGDIGYDLVVPTEEAAKLPDADMGETEKVEGPNKVTVPMVKTSAPMSQFSTSQLTVIVRPKKDASGKPLPNQYIILSAFPGKDLPRASEWGDKYAVVMPESGKSEAEPLQEGFLFRRNRRHREF